MSCAAPNSYAGISFASGAAPVNLQEWARRAQLGDKEAQLELGVRFEEGNGVPVNLARAKSLYRSAATTSGGTAFVYVPASRPGRKGMIIPISRYPKIQGLELAKQRLKKIEDMHETEEN